MREHESSPKPASDVYLRDEAPSCRLIPGRLWNSIAKREAWCEFQLDQGAPIPGSLWHQLETFDDMLMPFSISRWGTWNRESFMSERP
jgi:hypothetical protein